MGAGLKNTLLAIFFAVAVPTLALAADDPPKACAPQDSHTMCALEVMRNNALNELAYWIGKDQDLNDHVTAIEAYWTRYLLGLRIERAKVKSYWLNYITGDDQVTPRLRADVRAVCSWRERTDDTERLCADWRKHEARHRRAVTAVPVARFK